MKNTVVKTLTSLVIAAAMLLAPVPVGAIASAATAATGGVEHFVYSFDFSSNPFDNGWEKKDADGDGFFWAYQSGGSDVYYHDAPGSVFSASYSDAQGGALTPDNWLISPIIDVPNGGVTKLTFWARGTKSGAFREKFRVSYLEVRGNGKLTTLSDTFTTENGWHEYAVDISPAANKMVQIVIEHCDCTGQYRLALDDFKIVNYGGPVNVYRCDFESDPFVDPDSGGDGWSLRDYDGDGHNWTYTPNAGVDPGTVDSYRSHSGTGSVYSASYEDGFSLDTRNNLATWYFTVPSNGTTTVSFWARGSHWLRYKEEFVPILCYRDTDTDSEGDLYLYYASITFGVQTATNGWKKYSFTLPREYESSHAFFMISHRCSGQMRLYVDDFSIDWQPDEGVVYGCDFEDDPFETTPGISKYFADWVVEDRDHDGYSWYYENSEWGEGYRYDAFPHTYSHSGSGALFSSTYWGSDDMDPEDRLISPFFYVPQEGTTTVSFWARDCGTEEFDEPFYVYYAIEDKQGPTYLGNYQAVNDWIEYSFTLPSSCKGENVCICIDHKNRKDRTRLFIDDFLVTNDASGGGGGGSTVMKGDMDKDGEITVADALKALRIAAKLVNATSDDMTRGDIDTDGEITVADALKILRVAAKLANASSLG